MPADKKTADYIKKAAKQTFNEAWNYLEKRN